MQIPQKNYISICCGSKSQEIKNPVIELLLKNCTIFPLEQANSIMVSLCKSYSSLLLFQFVGWLDSNNSSMAFVFMLVGCHADIMQSISFKYSRRGD